MYERRIILNLKEALADSPVVLVNGARQTGKTTLVQQFVPVLASPNAPAGVSPHKDQERSYLTLDDPTVLASAKADPVGFIAGLGGATVIDEVQRAPELFSAIKMSVDRDRMPGRFLLTGSADILLLPGLADSLAGRMEIQTLWPLAQAEIEGASVNVVDLLFEDDLPQKPLPGVGRAELIGRLLAGGYPESLMRKSEARRRSWFNSYVIAILQRDVRDIANIEGLSDLPRLLALLASRTAALLNRSDIATSIQMPYTTLHRYMAILEATFLVQQLPAWTTSLGQRLVKSPKLLIHDTGLAANLQGLDSSRLVANPGLIGSLLETMVAMELKKAAGWSRDRPALYHYRTQARQEVDLVVENAAGQVVGIEVKAAASVASSDFRGMRSLMDSAGEQFVRGIVLYTGGQIVPFGARLHAVPLSFLWT